MNYLDHSRWNEAAKMDATVPKDFDATTNELCEKALNDAKEQLHPLLRNVELNRLEKRSEFLQAFRPARELAVWKPSLLAIYSFDETRHRSRFGRRIEGGTRVPENDPLSTGSNLRRDLLTDDGWITIA